MAVYQDARCRMCRREGMKLFLKGDRCYTDKCAIERRAYAPGEHGKSRRIKETNYGVQLREKQKARRIYGVLERQFRNYFEKAAESKGVTGEVLLQMLERRLDNVVYRLGFAVNRNQARQLVRHGHFLVNGRKVDIPSFLVKPGDEVVVREKSRKLSIIVNSLEARKGQTAPEWLDLSTERLAGRVLNVPSRAVDPDAGQRAAHRRALLEVTHAFSSGRLPDEVEESDHAETGGRGPRQYYRVRQVRHRAAGAGVRDHAGQRAAARAALVAAGRGDHRRAHRGRAPRVLDPAGRDRGRDRDHPQPEAGAPEAPRRRPEEGHLRGERQARGEGGRHEGGRRRRDPQPRPPHRHPEPGRRPAHGGGSERRPRLRLRRPALADGPAHRGDPDRLAVLAGHQGELPRSRPPASASASTTTS